MSGGARTGSVAARIWHRVEGVGRLVALTFDDCDTEAPWLAILDALERDDAPAAFFPNGFRVERFAAAARRTVAAGHDVGSHGFDHARLTDLGRAGIRSRLDADRAVWRSVAATDPSPLLRPPYGAVDDAVAGAAAESGFTDIVLWDVDPQDWTERDPIDVSRRVLRDVRGGSIVALHVTAWTAEALPAVLTGIRRRGLRPAPLTALLRAVSAPPIA